MESALPSKIFFFGPLLVFVLFLAAVVFQVSRAEPIGMDFVGLYSGASLAGTPGLYSVEGNRELGRETSQVDILGLYFIRPPFYAVLLHPLTRLPVWQALYLFQAVQLTLLAWLGWRWFADVREIMLFVAISAPIYLSTLLGQDSVLVLVAVGASILAYRRDRPVLAGVLLALGAIKFHLLLLIPVVLVIRKEWRVLAGGAAGGVVLTVVSFLAQGWSWPREYLAIITREEVNPVSDWGMSLRTILDAFGWDQPAYSVLGALGIAALVMWIAARVPNTELALAAALVGGQLAGYHVHVPDAVLYLAVFVLLRIGGASQPAVWICIVMLTPFPYIALLSKAPPFNVATPLVEVGLLIAMLYGTFAEAGQRLATPKAPVEA